MPNKNIEPELCILVLGGAYPESQKKAELIRIKKAEQPVDLPDLNEPRICASTVCFSGYKVYVFSNDSIEYLEVSTHWKLLKRNTM